MATSFTAAFSEPRYGSPIVHVRRACFGSFNCTGHEHRQFLDKMEWHPEVGNSTPTAKECVDFVHSFGFWEGLFHLTSLGGVASNFDGVQADQLITAYMTARNCNTGYYNFLDGNIGSQHMPDDIQRRKILFTAYVIGVSTNVFGQINVSSGVDNNESTTIVLYDTDDAYALYLMAFGTKDECQGLFVQGRMFQGLNDNGYIRNQSRNLSQLRRTLTSNQGDAYANLADWMRAYLRGPAAENTGKLGRLTVGQFKNRMRERSRISNANGLEVFFSMFEELKDLYS